MVELVGGGSVKNPDSKVTLLSGNLWAIQKFFVSYDRNIARLRKAALNTSHWGRGVKLVYFTKKCHSNYYCHYCHYYHNHNLSFGVLSLFWSFWVSSQFEFLNFVAIWVFEFCHNLSFGVLSKFEFLSFFRIWVLEFCYNLSFRVLSQFEFFEFCHNLTF